MESARKQSTTRRLSRNLATVLHRTPSYRRRRRCLTCRRGALRLLLSEPRRTQRVCRAPGAQVRCRAITRERFGRNLPAEAAAAEEFEEIGLAQV